MTPSNSWKLIPKRTQLMIAAAAVLGVGIAGAAIVKSGGDRKATIPAGTDRVAALERTISTKNAEPGDNVVIFTTKPLDLGDNVTIPSGVELRGEVTHANGGGRIAGAPELTLRFTRLSVDGNRYQISAEPFRVKGTSDRSEERRVRKACR